MSFNAHCACALFSVFFLHSCVTNTVTQEDIKQENPVSQNEEKTDIEKCTLLLNHVVKIQNKGTRSERQDGYLQIKEYTLPDLFVFVQQDGKAFSFSVNTKRFGRTGYHITNTIELQVSNKFITEEEKERGWYIGSALKVNTPRCWLFVQWNGGSAYIDPQKAETTLDNPPFNAIYPISRLNTRLLN